MSPVTDTSKPLTLAEEIEQGQARARDIAAREAQQIQDIVEGVDQPEYAKLLTTRQKAFVREYLQDMNADAASIRAGYASASIGSALLALPKIRYAVDCAVAQRAARVGMTSDTVLHELSMLSHSSIDHYCIDDFGNVSLTEGAPDGAMAAVRSIKKRIKHGKDGEVTYEVDLQLWDKPSTLKLMGRHTGIKAFTDRFEVSGPDGGPVPVSEVRMTIVDTPKQGNE